MSEQLVIYLHNTETLSADWMLTDRNGEKVTALESGSLTELAEKNKLALKTVQRTLCLIPASLAHCSHINVPAKNRQRALQAIPFAIEDQLADDVEDLHFAIGKPVNTDYPFVAIRQQTLVQLLANLRELGIEPDALIIDALCTEHAANQWSLIQNAESFSLRTDHASVIAADTDTLEFIVASSLQQTEHKPDSVIIYADSEKHAATLSEIFNNHDITAQTRTFTQSILTALQIPRDLSSIINLLQGKYQVVKQSNQWWKPWRAAAIIAAIAIGLSLAFEATQVIRLQQNNQRLQDEINRIYKTSFPQSKRVVNARVQMENELKQLKKSSGKTDYSFTDILIDAAPIISQSNGAEIQAINYHNRKLEIQLLLANLSAAESLKNSLNKLAGLRAELVSASSESNQVNARIKLEAL